MDTLLDLAQRAGVTSTIKGIVPACMAEIETPRDLLGVWVPLSCAWQALQNLAVFLATTDWLTCAVTLGALYLAGLWVYFCVVSVFRTLRWLGRQTRRLLIVAVVAGVLGWAISRGAEYRGGAGFDSVASSRVSLAQ